MKISKIILGAKNTDLENIKNIIEIYAKAGADMFDLCADAKTIEFARDLIDSLGLKNPPQICASITLKDDIHARKAKILKEKCEACHKCAEICPQKAIKNCTVKTERCTGCKLCEKICPVNAIEMLQCENDFEEQFKQAKTADFIEIHTNGKDENIEEIFGFLKANFGGEIGICISNNENDTKKIEIIKMIRDIIAPKILIVQADGASISGFSNEISTTEKTLQECAKFADIKGIKLIMSGGTNAMTYAEAIKRGLTFDGIAWGSFSRKIVAENPNTEQALCKAAALIAPLK